MGRDGGTQGGPYFNPHEREARDRGGGLREAECADFNPHEREARDSPRMPPTAPSHRF